MRLEEARKIATAIMDRAGTHIPGTFDVIVSELCKIDVEPDLHQQVALELVAAAGITTPGSFDLLVDELRRRYPSEQDVHDVVAKVKRRVSLKTGKIVPQRSAVRR